MGWRGGGVEKKKTRARSFSPWLDRAIEPSREPKTPSKQRQPKDVELQNICLLGRLTDLSEGEVIFCAPMVSGKELADSFLVSRAYEVYEIGSVLGRTIN